MNKYEALGRLLTERENHTAVFEKKDGTVCERRMIAFEATASNKKDDQFYTVGPTSTGYVTYWDVDKERPGMFHADKLRRFDGVDVA